MISNLVYNLFLTKLTSRGYGRFFETLAPKSRILDIGVGNGLMLKKHHHTIKELELELYGIDLNKRYLEQCAKLVNKYGLGDRMQVALKNFLSDELPTEGFDVIFFSQSFMLIDDKKAAVDRALSLLNEGGQIVFFQTMEDKAKPFKEFLKPKLKYISGIDFGKVTYRADFERLIAEAGLVEIAAKTIMKVSDTSHSRMIFAGPAGSLHESCC